MDIIFTKVGLLVQLEFWTLPQGNAPAQLMRTEILTVEQATRTISNQRPDILAAFTAWANATF